MEARKLNPLEERILVFTPTGRDARLACDILTEAGFVCHACSAVEELCSELEAGAGAALMAEEALCSGSLEQITAVLRRQPPWSDLPIVVFTGRGDTPDAPLETLAGLGNVTMLERPVRITTLVSAIRAGLRARRRQYQVRDLLHRLEEHDRRKDQFLAMLGHELRNPLAAIRNALQVLQQASPSDHRTARQQAVIDRQTRHLNRLVDDLLDVSRVTFGKITLKREILDLREIAERSVQTLRAAIEEQRHEVTIETGSEPVFVEGDPVRLEQIVTNLLNNAVKYTPVNGRIWLTVDRKNEAAVVRIRDNGIGIPPEMLPQVFDLFTQAAGALHRPQGGLGLGLSLVQHLVRLHEGKIEARSDGPGTGSEFIVRLPAVDRLPDGTERLPDRGTAQPPGEPGAHPPGRVLIVEDNPDGRETLRDLMELWGYEVEVAEDGQSGLERALASVPEVMLVDIGLPGLDGYEVARQLRARCNGRAPRLIAMTGYGQPEDRRRALEAGFDHHLVKPVDTQLLAELLDGTAPQ